MKHLFSVLLIMLVMATAVLVAAPTPEPSSEIVATTSWTAAFAIAAGAEDVRVLAPYQMRHPPEYELSPSDLVLVSDAKYVIYAGYEGMVPRIKEAVGGDTPELIQIKTDFSPGTIEASIMKIGHILGTEDQAKESIAGILAFYEAWRREIAEAGFAGTGIIVHLFQRPLTETLGARTLGIFGPGPLEAKQIAVLSELPATLIVDNYHNDVGKPLRETMKDVPVVEFINFPGTAGTVTLMDVLRENRSRLKEVLKQ